MTQELPPRKDASSGTDRATPVPGGSRLQGAALMSTALKMSPASASGIIRTLGNDFREVQRRLAALSRIASRLPRLQSEAELLAEVVDNLLSYFEGARLVEVF